jgi:hypothetical protein
MRHERGGFIDEVEKNSLIDETSKKSVLMSAFVGSDEVTAPFVFDAKIFWDYSYIVIPYYKNNTLLDLIMRANSKR